uniref:Uncharacterized protein n=1 Tax=Rhizophora mucronata TaxID=61149 RepID=A0A2P2ING8_RHIMU
MRFYGFCLLYSRERKKLLSFICERKEKNLVNYACRHTDVFLVCIWVFLLYFLN